MSESGSIVVICGTNRPESNTRRVVNVIVDAYQALGAQVSILDLADLPPEIFSPTAYAEKPPSFERFSETILNSAGLHVVTPEYNGGMPGVLKLFIDHLKFPESFEARPVCFVGVAAGQWGALRPVEHLQQIFSYRNAYVYPKRVFIPGINEHIGSSGAFENAELAARLAKQADGFRRFVAAVNSLE